LLEHSAAAEQTHAEKQLGCVYPPKISMKVMSIRYFIFYIAEIANNIDSFRFGPVKSIQGNFA